jgi:beta-glucosidase
MSRLLNKVSRGVALVGLAVSFAAQAPAQQSVATVTGDARVDDLLSRMTLEEKILMIHGEVEPAATNQGEAGYLEGIPRLGIPSLRLSDGPPGVLTREPSQAETATMGVAATFSRKDAEENGIVIGREAKSLGIDLVLEPFINMDRDITFQRGYNTFGEDPFLTGQIGAAEIRGIQAQGIMAQAKHYVAYDTGADSVVVDQQTLHEIYVAPFKDAVDAGVSSIMCSYNYVNGERACGNSDTLNKILKKELGFKGFVTSDWGATHAADYISKGLDMEMPGTVGGDSPMAAMMFSFFNYKQVSGETPKQPDMGAMMAAMGGMGGIPEEMTFDSGGGFPGGPGGSNDKRVNLWELLHNGTVKESEITQAVGRVLLQYKKFGFLDHKPQHEILPHQEEANAKVIQKTGEDAAVLLKNEGNMLPLKAADLASLAMIGPGAGQVVAIGTAGERSVGFPWRQVGPVDAIKKIDATARIRYAPANDMNGTPIPAAVFSHDGQPGLARSGDSGQQVDAQIDFTKANGKAFPVNAKASWKGTLTIPADGTYYIYFQIIGATGNLSIDGKQIASVGSRTGSMHGDTVQANQDNVLPTPDCLDNVRRAVTLTAGPHAIEANLTGGDTSGAAEQIRLNWVTPEQQQANHDAAITAAKESKTAVVFAWGRGTPQFGLPGDQDKLIEEVAAANPNTIVVLNVSQPIAMPWLDKVRAVLLMWWPGDEGGPATANILLGKSSPAGRLPFTWAKRLEDYCCAANPAYPERTGKGVDGKTTFSEGVHVGYRWFDKEKIEPLFPFGYGLSYASFEYSKLHVQKSMDGGVDVSLTIRNTGQTASDEVPQVYLGAPEQIPAGVQFPVRSLVAFNRISFAPGESKIVRLHVNPRHMEYWSTATGKWVMPKGKRTLSVGASSRDLRVSAVVGSK